MDNYRQSVVDMDDLFEDEEYGKNLLGIVRRGTSDTVEYHVVPLVAEPEENGLGDEFINGRPV